MTLAVTRVKWHPEAAIARAKAGIREANLAAAELLKQEANRHAPLEGGTLIGTAATSVDAETGDAIVSYDTPYAARLHEHPEYDFQNGREGKWLQRTLDEAHGVELAQARVLNKALR